MLGRMYLPNLALLLVCARASADSPRVAPVAPKSLPDIPHVVSARLTDEHNWMWVDCELVTAQPPFEARCTFRQAWLRRPRQNADLVATVKAMATKAWGPDQVKACARESTLSVNSPTLVSRRSRVLDACRRRDAKAFSDIVLQDLDRESATCDMVMPPVYDLRFRQVDANTWVNTSNEGSAGFCVATTTTMLWRSSPDDFFWNASTSRVVPPNAVPECVSLAYPRRDWTSYDHDQLSLPCTFIGP